jgi:hypothetical protein
MPLLIPLLIPFLGLVLWLIHVVASLQGESLPWARLAWILYLPIAAVGAVVFWAIFVPSIKAKDAWFDDQFLAWMSSAFLCFAAWFTFLVLEIFLSVLAQRARTRRASSQNVDTSPSRD